MGEGKGLGLEERKVTGGREEGRDNGRGKGKGGKKREEIMVGRRDRVGKKREEFRVGKWGVLMVGKGRGGKDWEKKEEVGKRGKG